MSQLLHRAASTARIAAIRSSLSLLGLRGVRQLARGSMDHVGMILMFHHVAPPRSGRLSINRGLEVTPETLDRVVSSLMAQDYDSVPRDAVPERLAQASAGRRRFAALTFDDGCRDTLLHAAPVLVRHGVPFTIYVTTGFASGHVAPWWHVVERAALAATSLTVETNAGRQWFDTASPFKKKRAAEALQGILWRACEPMRAQQTAALAAQAGLDLHALTRELYMDWRELAEIAALPGCAIGAHTESHARLADLDESAVMQEIGEPRDVIRKRLGIEARHFSYPYGVAGACEQREFTLARTAGFATAVTTRRGVLTQTDIAGLTSLPRVPINGHYQRQAMIDALVCGLPMVLAAQTRALMSAMRDGARHQRTLQAERAAISSRRQFHSPERL